MRQPGSPFTNFQGWQQQLSQNGTWADGDICDWGLNSGYRTQGLAKTTEATNFTERPKFVDVAIKEWRQSNGPTGVEQAISTVSQYLEARKTNDPSQLAELRKNFKAEFDSNEQFFIAACQFIDSLEDKLLKGYGQALANAATAQINGDSAAYDQAMQIINQTDEFTLMNARNRASSNETND